jgi:uncharacterized protein (TIGR02186 family)
MTVFSLPALATPLVGDLSNYRIDIDSGFNGTRIFLFGARNDNGDIVVVVRGPEKNYMLRRKEKVAGIWINRDRMKLFGMPDFYVIAASQPIASIPQSAAFRRLGIGQENLFSPPADPALVANFNQFAAAFLRHQQERQLYMASPEPVTFMGETLFKTTLVFPDNIPSGNYTAEIYLLSDGEVVGMQSTPIKVTKSGMDAFLYNYAHEHPVLYGISAVVLALGIGWFAGRAFEKA